MQTTATTSKPQRAKQVKQANQAYIITSKPVAMHVTRFGTGRLEHVMACSAMKKPATAEEEEEEEQEDKQKLRACCVDVELMERELDCHVDKQEFVIYNNKFEVRRPDNQLIKQHAKLIAHVRNKVAPNLSLAQKPTENALYLIGRNREWDLPDALLQRWSEEMAARLRTLCRDAGSLLARKKWPGWVKAAMEEHGVVQESQTSSSSACKDNLVLTKNKIDMKKNI